MAQVGLEHQDHRGTRVVKVSKAMPDVTGVQEFPERKDYRVCPVTRASFRLHKSRKTSAVLLEFPDRVVTREYRGPEVTTVRSDSRDYPDARGRRETPAVPDFQDSAGRKVSEDPAFQDSQAVSEIRAEMVFQGCLVLKDYEVSLASLA
jgi:hypothetical protein